MAAPKDLYEFLTEAELQHYFNSFKNDLKVTSVPQIKYVEEEDLLDMGMSKPEIRRLKKFFKRECPQGALGKIKKVCEVCRSWLLFLLLTHNQEISLPQNKCRRIIT